MATESKKVSKQYASRANARDVSFYKISPKYKFDFMFPV